MSIYDPEPEVESRQACRRHWDAIDGEYIDRCEVHDGPWPCPQDEEVE